MGGKTIGGCTESLWPVKRAMDEDALIMAVCYWANEYTQKEYMKELCLQSRVLSKMMYVNE